MRTSIFILAAFFISSSLLLGQNCLKPTIFTWEGALKGNKAVWKVDDTSNTYIADDGVSIKVSITDPNLQNTTRANPSEFGDYTKTNTFYGNGSLALQITAKKTNQPVCMEYEFSKNILLNSFDVWDIDFIAHIPRPESTYQDSLSFAGFDKFGEVALVLSPMVRGHNFTIINQSVISGYDRTVNGDLNHRDSTGAIRVSSIRPITKLVLCYANGSKDDGLSNSQAARISSFSYCEYLGSISGQVLVDGSFSPLPNVNVRLLNVDGTSALGKNGLPITTISDANGAYSFIDVSMGNYIVAIASPIGYESSRDLDDINDNRISITLDTRNSNITDRNFYQVAASPLPVMLSEFNATYMGQGNVLVSWQIELEQNNDFYTISTSVDGISYRDRGQVLSRGNTKERANYDFMLSELQSNANLYVALRQTDLDGKSKHLGIQKLKIGDGKGDFQIWPNPVSSHINLVGGGFTENLSIELFNLAGQSMAVPNLMNNNQVDVSSLIEGVYFLRLSSEGSTQVLRFVKD